MIAVSSAPKPSVKRLWSLAPIWKAMVVLAIVSSWLFLLFPPHNVVDKARELAQFGPEASYKPRARSSTMNQGLVQAPQVRPASSSITDTGGPAAQASSATTEPPSKLVPRSANNLMAKATIESPSKQPIDATSPTTRPLAAAVMGQTFSKTFSVDGHAFPLPEGQWQVLADLPARQQDIQQHQYALGHIDHQVLRGFVAFVSIQSTVTPSPGFPAFPSCDAGSNYFAETEVNTPFDRQACWSIRSVHSAGWSRWADRSAKLNPLERAAAGQLEAMKVHIPQDMIALEFDLGSKQARLIGVYMFNPEVEGIAPAASEDPASSPWMLSNVAKDPKTVSFIQNRKAWGRGNWPLFKNAFVER